MTQNTPPAAQPLAVPQAEQIRALLAAHLIGIDHWVDRNIGPRIETYDVPFGDVFTVSEADVVAHVLAHGWDLRIVKPLAAAQPRIAGDWDVMFYAGLADDGRWQAWRPLDPERHSEPFAVDTFDTEAAMVAALVHQLFETQKRFWG